MHSHGSHSQRSPGAQGLSERVGRLLAVAMAPFLLATVVGVIWLWPSGELPSVETVDFPTDLVSGEVIGFESRNCDQAEQLESQPCRAVEVELESGTRVEMEEFSTGRDRPLQVGDKIVVGKNSRDEGGGYYFADYQRRTPLLLLGGIFVLMVIGLARWKGVRALAGFGLSLLVLVRFVIPAILQGKNPLLVALFGSSVVMLVALYFSHGLNVRTTTAAIGTFGSLILTGILAYVFVKFSSLSGFTSEEATFLNAASGTIQLQGLLLGGIIIGSLGVLDDVTITQASAVWELRAANPNLRGRELYGAALRIGRDHIAATVNTLVLAYAGASLPLLILFALGNVNLSDALNGEVIAEEIVRTLVGSIGLISAVPITTALAAFVAARRTLPTGP